MIATSIGTDVVTLVDKVISRAYRYKQFVICSPFLDEKMSERIVELLIVGRRAQCGVQIITVPGSAETLRLLLPGHQILWKDAIVTHRRLHAKVYVATARRTAESEAIVTSANLTICGVFENIEFGIRVLGTSEQGRRVLDQVHHFVRRIAA